MTVIFGGPTGIEVSTVVAASTLGKSSYKMKFSTKMYKRELIYAGVCAGIAILFRSPIAGALFAVEVIARKFDKTLLLSCFVSAVTSKIIPLFLHGEPIIPQSTRSWQWKAIPFMLNLSLLGGLLSSYFTISVIRIKGFFSGINNNFIRVNSGALIVGAMICFSPFLYGDSYHALKEMATRPAGFSIILLLLLAIIKPLASSLTLGAGGDAGVFAPSIVAGAFLGLALAVFCNTYPGTSLIYLNFMLAGAAAVLSASISAPFTALLLVCNLIPNGFILFFPILSVSLVSNYFAKRILPYNVTYGLETAKHSGRTNGKYSDYGHARISLLFVYYNLIFYTYKVLSYQHMKINIAA